MPDAPLNDVAIDDLVSEYLAGRRRGDRVSVVEFARRHPHWEDEIRRLLPAALALERIRGHRKATASVAASQAGELLAETRLGDFLLLEEIGHGGMGVVYKARQTSLGRIVALKVLRAGAMAVPKHARRFEREAQAAARLHHTNIVPVFGVGHQDGIHYYVMQWIEGEGLDRVIAELGRMETAGETTAAASAKSEDARRQRATASDVARVLLGAGQCRSAAGRNSTLNIVADSTNAASRDRHSLQSAATLGGAPPSAEPSNAANGSAAADPPATATQASSEASINRQYWRSVARIGLEAAQALEYAHSQGTLHRDVKPGNLIVDRRGTVWITDFGLAKLLHNESLTETGDVVGTLRYMSPEQFRGQADGRSDVYGLGVTLYELVTLRPAFDASGRAGLLDQILRQEPVRPRKLRPSMPRDLETIILKAISREPNHRYQTAGEMAADLERFLDDQPVRARRIGPLERFWRWCRRNPATALPTAAAAVLLALACGLATGAYLRETSLRATAEYQTRRAERGLSQAEAQRKLAEQNYTKAQTEQQRAEQNANAAQRQQRRAEANLALALQAFEQVFERVAPSVLPRPNEVDAGDEAYEPPYQVIVSVEDAALLQSMLTFYDRFAEENTTNRKLQSEAAKAHRRVGDIHQRLGQLQEAETAYRRALALYRRLDKEHPDDQSHHALVAPLLNELGQVQRMMYHREDAQRSHRDALAILDEMYRQSPNSPEIMLELIRTHHLYNNAIWGLKSRASDDDVQLVALAEMNSRKALELVEKLIETDPQNPEYRLTLARCYRELVAVHWNFHRRREAADSLLKSIGILDKLVSEYPTVPLYRYELVYTLSSRDDRLWGESGITGVCARFERAIELARLLSEEFPLVPEYATRYAYTCYKYGRMLDDEDLDRRAEELLRQSVELRREQTERFADVPHCRFFHAFACGQLANHLKRHDRLDEARELLSEAIELLIGLDDVPHIKSRGFLVQYYNSLGGILASQGEEQAAADAFQSAGELSPPATQWRFPPNTPAWRRGGGQRSGQVGGSRNERSNSSR